MKWRKYLKVINSIVTTLLFIVLLLTLFLVISTNVSGGEKSLFGYELKTVLSGSMEPDIKTGSIISIKKGGDMTRFEKGDIITFIQNEEIFVTHRIIQVDNEGEQYITKGDANNGPDSHPVLSEHVIGKYTGLTIPYVGYVMNFTNSKEGAVLLLILPGVILLGYSFVSIWRIVNQIERSKT